MFEEHAEIKNFLIRSLVFDLFFVKVEKYFFRLRNQFREKLTGVGM